MGGKHERKEGVRKHELVTLRGRKIDLEKPTDFLDLVWNGACGATDSGDQ